MAINNLYVIYKPARQQTGIKYRTVEINVILSKHDFQQKVLFQYKMGGWLGA